MPTDRDHVNASFVVKAVLAGIGTGATFATGGATLAATVATGGIVVGLTVLNEYLERVRNAHTKKDQEAAMNALQGLILQGFELQRQYEYDLTVFLQGTIKDLSQQMNSQLASLDTEVADAGEAICAVQAQSDLLAQAIRRLTNLVEAHQKLATMRPLGFHRLDRHLFIDGGGEECLERQERLTPTLFRSDGPNWTDFMFEVPFRRPEVDQVVEHLENDQHDKRVVVLQGESASGKTVIARYVGYLLTTRGRPVYHADFHELCQGSGLDPSNLSAFFAQLDAGIHKAQEGWPPDSADDGHAVPTLRPVFIVEDLHRESHDTAVRFLQILNESLPAGADFILATRPATEPKPDGQGYWSIWEHAASRAYHSRSWLVGAPQDFGNVVSQLSPHIWRKRWKLVEADPPFELDSARLKQLANEAKESLWLLAWILAGHGGDPKQVFDNQLALDEAGKYLRMTGARSGLWDLEMRLRGKPIIPALILAVSVFSRWEVPVDRFFIADILLEGEPRVAQDELDRAFADLVETSELLSEGNGAVRLPHSALADVYLQAEEDTDVANYAQGCVDAFIETLGDDECAVVHSIVGSWQEMGRHVHPDELNSLETRLLSVALIKDNPGGSFGLFNDWRLAAAAAEAVENTGPAATRAILKGFIRCVAHARLNASRSALDQLKKLVHGGKLDSRQIIGVSDELCRAAKGHQVADIVEAFSWFAPNDEQTVEWLKQQWEAGRSDGQVDIETQAACALANRGYAEEKHWETIHARLLREDPPGPVLMLVRRFPQECWIEPLRRLLHSTDDVGLLWYITGAWAAHSTVADPDEIIAEIALAAERLIGILLIGGDVLPRIDSPGVVDLLLGQTAQIASAPAGGRAYGILHRLCDLWLPRAVEGFASVADQLDKTAKEVLQELVSTDTGESTYYQTEKSLLKEAACEVAGRLNLAQLPTWLLETLGDTSDFVAADAAAMLGWWEVQQAVDVLADVLTKVDTEPPSVVPGLAPARALSCIGGARAVDALLNWPVRFEDGEMLSVMLEFLADATTDIDAVSVAISRCSQRGVADDLLVAAAQGVSGWAWRDWYAWKHDKSRPAQADVDQIRDEVCAILSGPSVRDERAWCSLINALGALGSSEQSRRVLQTYLDTESSDLKASAIMAAAWSGQCLGEDLLALARGIDAETMSWVNRDVLTSVVRVLLNHDAEMLDALSPKEVESVTLALISDYRFDDLEKFATRHPERVRKVLAAQVEQKPLSWQSDNALNAAAVRFASEALAERFQTENCTEWSARNVWSFAVELRRYRESAWSSQQDLKKAAVKFLSEALMYPNVRVRDASGAALSELDQEPFSKCIHRMMDSEEWRDRAAATEASGLLEQSEFADILEDAGKDVDSRVRSPVYWAKERTREREAQDAALNAIQDSPGVPSAFRWKQTLIRAGDDWGLLRVDEIILDPEATPAKVNWLKTVHEDMKREWEKRTRERDRSIKWED